MQKGLAGTELEFSLPAQAGNRNLLAPLIARLQKLQQPVDPVDDPPARENVTDKLPNILKRVSGVEESARENATSIEDLRVQVNKLVSDLAGTQGSVSRIQGALKVLSLFTLVSLGLLVYLMVLKQKESKQAEEDAKAKDALTLAVGQFETRLTRLESAAEKANPGPEDSETSPSALLKRIELLEQRIPELQPPAPGPDPDPPVPGTSRAEIESLEQAIKEVKGNINLLFKEVVPLRPLKERLTHPSRVALDLEVEILRGAWQKFSNNKLAAAILERAQTMGWEEVRELLLSQLPPAVPEELKPTFDTVVAPARDFHNMVAKLGLVQLLLNNDKELPPLSSDQALLRVRELISLLTMIQNSNLVADRLNFHFEKWVEDQFLSFADLYMQKYQKAQLENDGARLEPGLQIVRRVLKAAGLEPVDLTLGVTPFDSTRHIGRSTTCDSNFANGLILGVVRNGFMRGGQVLRQPEVIVNRVG